MMSQFENEKTILRLMEGEGKNGLGEERNKWAEGRYEWAEGRYEKGGVRMVFRGSAY